MPATYETVDIFSSGPELNALPVLGSLPSDAKVIFTKIRKDTEAINKINPSKKIKYLFSFKKIIWTIKKYYIFDSALRLTFL